MHLIVHAEGPGLIDFWPGTGRWIVRNTKKRMFGVFNLLRYIKVNGRSSSDGKPR